jgi:hypothetical protein
MNRWKRFVRRTDVSDMQELGYFSDETNSCTFMNARTQQILLHVAGCLVVLALPLLFSPEDLSLWAYLTNPPTQREILFNALVIAVFYINYYGLIPKFYFSRRYLFFLLINIAGFVAINFMASYVNTPRPPSVMRAPFPGGPPSGPAGGPPPLPHGPSHHSFFMDISQHLFVFLFVLFLALLLKIRERLKQAEREKLQTELSYLKARINPHFLFNIHQHRHGWYYFLRLLGSSLGDSGSVPLRPLLKFSYLPDRYYRRADWYSPQPHPHHRQQQ